MARKAEKSGGVTALLEQVRPGLLALGYHPRLALAPTPLGATFLARADQERVITDKRALRGLPHGQAVRTGGLVINRQRRGTATGVVFLTLEDETGCGTGSSSTSAAFL